MSSLAQYAGRRAISVGRGRRRARVDERTLLNRPAFDGGAHVRAFVEDTSGRTRRLRKLPPSPRLRLRVADCVNEISLEFSVESAELRDNALFKLDTLIGVLERFRAGLVLEADLFVERQAAARPSAVRHLIRPRKEDRCRI